MHAVACSCMPVLTPIWTTVSKFVLQEKFNKPSNAVEEPSKAKN